MVESAEETAISLHESFYFNGNWKVKKADVMCFFCMCGIFSGAKCVAKTSGS